jgi:hypothetical protein
VFLSLNSAFDIPLPSLHQPYSESRVDKLRVTRLEVAMKHIPPRFE